jgi:uncharacterized protein (DUF488 family)
MSFFTIGHSTRSFDEFLAALRSAGIDCVVDVRRFPRSRRHPQFNTEALARALPEAGIAYHHLAELGGRRSRGTGPSANTLWREDAFRNYADYAETPEFGAAFARLKALEAGHNAAIMCAEAVWWRCHRRIITDYLVAGGAPVTHILGAGKLEPARLTDGAAVRADGSIRYAAAQGQLGLPD